MVLRALLIIGAGIGFAAASAATPAAAPPAAGATLQLAPCRLEQPQGLSSVAAECGTLRVPENPAQPQGRQIELYVARVAAVSQRKAADPLFVLAGGPGMGATVFYASVAPAFARIQRERDIVLVDQRGTGHSNPLQCEFDDEELAVVDPAEVAKLSRRCLGELAKANDVSMFTTSVAVRDLDAVRAALGYERIDLYGGSYGTRVAQHYARRYPARTRALILDGIAPPQLVLGPGIATDAQAALERIFARCREQSTCRTRFDDPERDYRELRAKLERAPMKVTVANPQTGAPEPLDFTVEALSVVLRLTSYSAEQASLLPLLLEAANRHDNFVPLAAVFVLTSQTIEEVMAYGMHNAVVCTEDVPFIEPAKLDRKALAATYMGAEQVDTLVALCDGWPRGPLDADLHAPLASNVPALLLSGSADPVTPAAYGEQAAKGFRDVLHLVLPDQGHGQLVLPCIDRVMADFIAAGTTKNLDAGCTRNLQPAAFFISLAGPPP